MSSAFDKDAARAILEAWEVVGPGIVRNEFEAALDRIEELEAALRECSCPTCRLALDIEPGSDRPLGHEG